MAIRLRSRSLALGIGAAAAVLLTVSACGGSTVGPAASGGTAKATGAVPSASSTSLLDAAKKEGTVVWYTSNTRPAATKIKALFEQKYPGITVDMFQAGGSQVLSKVAAELNAGGLKADVVDYSDGAAMVEQAGHGVFARFAPEHSDAIPSSLKGDNGYWVSPNFLTTNLAYNTQVVSANDAPKSWQDLLDPKWKGKVGMASPDYAGTAISTIAALENKFGADYLKKLGANGLKVFQGFGDVENALVSGQISVAIMLNFRDYADQAKGQPVKVVTPSEGQIELPLAIGINAHATHPNAARLFENFVVGDEVQKFYASEYFFPVRSDITADTPGLPNSSSLKLFSPDLKKLADPQYVATVKQHFKDATS